MARYPLTEKIEEFTHHAAKLVGQRGWEGRLTAAWNQKRVEFEDKTLGSQKQYIIKFRKALRDWFEQLPGDDDRKGLEAKAMEIIGFPDGMIETLNAEYQKAVKHKAENLVLVKNGEAMVEAAVEWVQSADLRQKALGIMLLTGRRFYEVLATAKFAPVLHEEIEGRRYRMKYVLAFAGQAKTRGADGTRFGQTYNIPVIPLGKKDNVPLVLKALDEIRQSREGARWAGMDYRELNSAESGRFNNQLRGALPGIDGMTDELREKLSVKWLRALYAELAYARFGSIRRTKSAFFAQILGHAEDDLKTSLSYMVMALGDDETEAEKARAEVQRLLDAVKLKGVEDRAAARAAAAGEPAVDDDGVIDDDDM
jgi:hypothetical protein